MTCSGTLEGKSMTLEKIGEQDLRWGLNGMMLLGSLNKIVGTWQNRLALMIGFVFSENFEFLLRITRYCVGPTQLSPPLQAPS